MPAYAGYAASLAEEHKHKPANTPPRKMESLMGIALIAVVKDLLDEAGMSVGTCIPFRQCRQVHSFAQEHNPFTPNEDGFRQWVSVEI